MARLFSPDPVHISIPEAVNESNVTIYVISVRAGTGKFWKLQTDSFDGKVFYFYEIVNILSRMY